MRLVFDLDLLACSWCGGRLRVIATVQDPLAGQAILAHRARSGAPAPPGPAPPGPAAPAEPAAQFLLSESNDSVHHQAERLPSLLVL